MFFGSCHAKNSRFWFIIWPKMYYEFFDKNGLLAQCVKVGKDKKVEKFHFSGSWCRRWYSPRIWAPTARASRRRDTLLHAAKFPFQYLIPVHYLWSTTVLRRRFRHDIFVIMGSDISGLIDSHLYDYHDSFMCQGLLSWDAHRGTKWYPNGTPTFYLCSSVHEFVSAAKWQ